MNVLVFILEMIGTVAFAVSGAVVALKKRMDIFGVAVLGVTTAVGGGVMRDLLLGKTPPAMFTDPVYALVAVVVSLVVFLPFVRRCVLSNNRVYELMLLISDSAGLGAFAAVGTQAVMDSAYSDNLLLAVFLGTITGVGGGVLRDLLANKMPKILAKRIYACAAIAGALICALLWNTAGEMWAMLACIVLTVVLRVLAAHFKWSLPRPREDEVDE